ncbi:MAG TPA: CmcI family methyltransferase [Solirubrobacteraceae bacterium]|nr:CmcI family methyltransferase [Solirubrobacteraceae bacterium]
MSELRTTVDRLFGLGRADEALRVVEAALEAAPGDTEVLTLRALCLAEIGQFEVALDVARLVLARDPGNTEVSGLLHALEPTLAPPSYGPTNPLHRSYRTEVPTDLLLRMQQALHHQRYHGRQIVKNPFDLMLYQRLVETLRPGTIIEIGSKAGGSGLFFADLLHNFSVDGRVRSFDVVPVTDVSHPLVTFAYGNGRYLAEALDDDEIAAMARPLLVIEDADHTEETTGAVLAFFHRYLELGDWIVIEDGNLSDLYPEQYPDWSSGPHRALQAFLREHAADYRVGAEYCDFYAYNGTTASNGFLERVGHSTGSMPSES